MRISLLTKYLLTMLAVALFTVGPVTILAVRGFLRDKSLDVFDRNNLIARNIASESQDELSGAASKMRLFAGVYLDPAIPAVKRVDIARSMFSHYGEFVRLSIVSEKSGVAPIRVYNRDALKRGGFNEASLDAAIDAIALPSGASPEGGVWVTNRTPTVELPILTIAVKERMPDGSNAMLVGDLLPEALFNLFQSESASKMFMLDGDGKVLAHPDAKRMAARDIAAKGALAQAAASGASNTTFEFDDEEGEAQLGTVASVGLGRAVVVAHTPERVAFAAARELVGNSVLIAIVVFVIAALTSFFLARRMTGPLLSLSRATEKIAKGEFGTTVTVSSRDEIGELAASFNKMGEELKERERKLEDARSALVQSEKMAAFGQLGAGIAHEVKNPLAGILGYSQLALRKAPDPALKNYLEIIEKETKRCKAIIENLLKFARQEKTVMDRVEVEPLIDEAVKLVEHQLNMNGVKIEKRVAPGLPAIFANANQLQQVLMNLSINAQHAMEKGGSLIITAEKGSGGPVADGVEIRVTDTGSGIPKEIQAKIFEPFFTTKPAGKGTGLGLSVTYGIIRDHKGLIAVESQVGVGTTFRMVLPLAPADAAPAAAAQ